MARRKMNLITKSCMVGLAMTGLLSTTGALAVDVTCDTGDCIGSETGGLWNEHGFGNCFYMLPTAELRNKEIGIGPTVGETEGSAQACIGGDLVPYIDVRVSRDGDPDGTVTEKNAYSWSYDGSGDFTFNAGASQYMPPECVVNGYDNSPTNTRRNGTFDNGDENVTRPILEPLSATLTLSDVTGKATLSYYFMNGNQECRELDWELLVNDNPEATGTIHDVEDGKYLVFNLTGIEGTETIRLNVRNDNETPACESAPIEGVNSIISGVFISGTDVCDPPTGVTRSLGYFKNRPTVINGTFDENVDSLLPQDFCGEHIAQDEVCEAVDFLRSRGGGINNFKRQGMAALLNCEAFGCSPEIQSLIMAGSDACASDSSSFDFGTAGDTLDAFNNSGHGLDLPYDPPSAQPKACSALSKGQLKQLEKLKAKDNLSKKQWKKLEKLKAKDNLSKKQRKKLKKLKKLAQQ